MSARFDLVVKAGRIADGTGMPSFTADVGIRDGRIAAIGRVDASAARRAIDASGLLVTPGFIDVHHVATIVNGEVLLEEGRHTGALPGQIVRG